MSVDNCVWMKAEVLLFFWLQPLVVLFHHQESLERCAAAAWSCRARRRFAWPSRRWKEVTRTNRGGTSSPRRQSWDSLTIPTSSGWRGWWRAVSTPVTPHWRNTSTNPFSKIYQNGTLGVTVWFRSKIKLKFRRLRSRLSKQNLYCVFALAFKRSLNLIREKPLPILDLQNVFDKWLQSGWHLCTRVQEFYWVSPA